jgi:hypothetical protein
MVNKVVTGLLILMIGTTISCSSAKDIEERKNLMMPKKSEMMRNSRYKEPAKRKTNKVKKNHRSKSKKHF